MAISGIEEIGATYVETSNATSSTIDSEEFLTLLCAQLENQDPLDPMNETEYVSQLCDLSSLEQMQLVNENLLNLQAYESAIIDEQAVDLIGKTVKAYDSSIDFNEEGLMELQFELEGEASEVFVYIYDSNGELVNEMTETGSFNSGEHAIIWDGTENEGNNLSSGNYTYEVFAVDESGNMVEAAAFYSGEVTSVYFGSGTATLQVGDREIALGDLVEVSQS